MCLRCSIFLFWGCVYRFFFRNEKVQCVTIRPTNNGMGVIVVRRQIVGNDALEAATGARGTS